MTKNWGNWKFVEKERIGTLAMGILLKVLSSHAYSEQMICILLEFQRDLSSTEGALQSILCLI